MSDIPIKELLKVHPQYNPARTLPSGSIRGVLDVYQELYEGGIRFANQKATYLRPRQADANPEYKKVRLACAEFMPTAGPIIDWSAGQCVIEMPRIEGDEYYEDLTKDMDGNGTDFEEQVREIARTGMIHRRAYIAVGFPKNDPSATNLKDAKGSGGLDAQICTYDPAMVEDWTYDTQGNLNFVRTHTIDVPQSGNLPGDIEKHCWTFIYPEYSEEYTAKKKVTDKDWPLGAVAKSSGKVPYDYGGQLPVIQPNFAEGLWAMNRVASPEMDVFNLATGLTFLDEAVCFQQLVIISDGEVKGVATGEKVAILLPLNSTINWLAPSMAPLADIDRQVDAKRQKIKETLLSIGLTASNDRYGQQSGEAKKEAKQPAVDMLTCYKSPIKDAYEKALSIIKYVRDEKDLEVSILGLGGVEDKEAKQEEELELQTQQANIKKPLDKSTSKE